MNTKDITNIETMQMYVEGVVNDLCDNLITKEEAINYLKDYTFRIINLTIERLENQ